MKYILCPNGRPNTMVPSKNQVNFCFKYLKANECLSSLSNNEHKQIIITSPIHIK